MLQFCDQKLTAKWGRMFLLPVHGTVLKCKREMFVNNIKTLQPLLPTFNP